MPNVGPAEILIILVVALLVFGPQKLPEIGRQVGKATRELRRMQASLRDEVRDVLEPVDERARPPKLPARTSEASDVPDGEASPPVDEAPPDEAPPDEAPPDEGGDEDLSPVEETGTTETRSAGDADPPADPDATS